MQEKSAHSRMTLWQIAVRKGKQKYPLDFHTAALADGSTPTARTDPLIIAYLSQLASAERWRRRRGSGHDHRPHPAVGFQCPGDTEPTGDRLGGIEDVHGFWALSQPARIKSQPAIAPEQIHDILGVLDRAARPPIDANLLFCVSSRLSYNGLPAAEITSAFGGALSLVTRRMRSKNAFDGGLKRVPKRLLFRSQTNPGFHPGEVVVKVVHLLIALRDCGGQRKGGKGNRGGGKRPEGEFVSWRYPCLLFSPGICSSGF